MDIFFRTVMGRRFFESTMPDLVTQLTRIATGLERLLDRIERGDTPAPASVPAASTAAEQS